MAGESIPEEQLAEIVADLENTYHLPTTTIPDGDGFVSLMIACPHEHYADHVSEGVAWRLCRIGATQRISVDQAVVRARIAVN